MKPKLVLLWGQVASVKCIMFLCHFIKSGATHGSVSVNRHSKHSCHTFYSQIKETFFFYILWDKTSRQVWSNLRDNLVKKKLFDDYIEPSKKELEEVLVMSPCHPEDSRVTPQGACYRYPLDKTAHKTPTTYPIKHPCRCCFWRSSLTS